jgi:hypothetical protein
MKAGRESSRPTDVVYRNLPTVFWFFRYYTKTFRMRERTVGKWVEIGGSFLPTELSVSYIFSGISRRYFRFVGSGRSSGGTPIAGGVIIRGRLPSNLPGRGGTKRCNESRQEWSCTCCEFFYIFNLSRFCKNIWSDTNLAKIYIWCPWPTASGT